MGAVDLVIQVSSPGAVSTGLQRIGRAGHQVGAPSRGKIFPKHRADLLEAAVVVERMQAGQIEATHYPRNPRSEEHTSELQSLMRISYAVFCLKKKTEKMTQQC